MIHRNKGDTQDLEKSVLIPRNEASQFRESILRILALVKLEDCKSDKQISHVERKVQQADIKHIYQLLEYFSDKE
ncbi:hypothetical protein [Algoriphagus pacificus]|uniref:Uncharacterized protein n=1 Tax=Algoriphagus pacificus TaxID=2811234 RepID=A0ABS3CK69_9BACT|nr:hypothetical protein [Algoriphagus pacificus]MBN7817504.1 hypothetical protein [Algoriphagus pacificus]